MHKYREKANSIGIRQYIIAVPWKVILIWVKESVNSELLPLFNELQTIFAQGPFGKCCSVPHYM